MTPHHNFGENLIADLQRVGFGALAKSDLETLIFYNLERADVISRHDRDAAVGLALRITPQRVRALRRSVVARYWTANERKAGLGQWITNNLHDGNLQKWRAAAKGKRPDVSYVPVLIEHASLQEVLRNELQQRGNIPYPDRSPDILWVSFVDLLEVADEMNGYQGRWQRFAMGINAQMDGKATAAGGAFTTIVTNVAESAIKQAVLAALPTLYQVASDAFFTL
jgi:hypothetical protein